MGILYVTHISSLSPPPNPDRWVDKYFSPNSILTFIVNSNNTDSYKFQIRFSLIDINIDINHHQKIAVSVR